MNAVASYTLLNKARAIIGLPPVELSDKQVFILGTNVGKYISSQALTTNTFNRNAGQSIQKMINHGYRNWKLAKDLINRQEIKDGALRSGVLSFETFLGDAVFNAISPDWMLGTLAQFTGIWEYISNGVESDKKEIYDFQLWKMLKQAEATKFGGIIKARKKLKDEYGKDRYKSIMKQRKLDKKLIALVGSGDEQIRAELQGMGDIKDNFEAAIIFREDIKNADTQKEINDLKEALREFTANADMGGYDFTGDAELDYNNLVKILKRIKLDLVGAEINKLVQAKLSRFYSNPERNTAWGADFNTMEGSEKMLRTEDYAMAYIKCIQSGEINPKDPDHYFDPVLIQTC